MVGIDAVSKQDIVIEGMKSEKDGVVRRDVVARKAVAATARERH